MWDEYIWLVESEPLAEWNGRVKFWTLIKKHLYIIIKCPLQNLYLSTKFEMLERFEICMHFCIYSVIYFNCNLVQYSFSI